SWMRGEPIQRWPTRDVSWCPARTTPRAAEPRPTSTRRRRAPTATARDLESPGLPRVRVSSGAQRQAGFPQAGLGHLVEDLEVLGGDGDQGDRVVAVLHDLPSGTDADRVDEQLEVLERVAGRHRRELLERLVRDL